MQILFYEINNNKIINLFFIFIIILYENLKKNPCIFSYKLHTKTIYIYALIIFETYHIKIKILVYRIRMTYHQTRKNTVIKNSKKQLIVR